MDANKTKALLEKLNKTMLQALEKASGRCIQLGHAEISLTHCIRALTEMKTADVSMIFNRVGLHQGQLLAQLDGHLNSLPGGHHDRPSFSLKLLEILSESWSFADLERHEVQLRSGHFLVALLRDVGWVASVDYAFVKEIDAQKVAADFDRWTAGSDEATRTVDGVAHVATDEVLDAFTVDLVARARKGEIDPVIGRDGEIFQLADILSRRRKNNPILVGEPGVGKSAIVEGLALMIAQEQGPAALAGTQIRTLDLGSLKAGASMKGEFEERMKRVIDAVGNSPVPVILFIDEAHTLIGAGGSAGSGDAANLLKPALARGKLRTIAATTWSEYKKYIEKDAALERRFQVVKVDEPSARVAASMLRGLKDKYENHHGVVILDNAIEAAAHLSDRFLSGRQLPDKAVDLLDTASARVRLSQESRPFALIQKEKQLESLSMEIKGKQEQLSHGVALEIPLDDLLAFQTRLGEETEQLKLRWQSELDLVRQLQECDPADSSGKEGLRQALAEIAGESPMVSYQVSAEVIADIVSRWTGIPAGKMMRAQLENVLNVQERIQSRVIGQDHAAARIARSIKTASAKVNNQDTPIGTFLAVGPSGVGKTEMALALADQLFGGERFVIQINMSEYQEKHTLSRLIGSPPGYVGYGEGGVLTEAVRQRPYSVVLLDEVEKGHPDVMNLFYQVFDKGHCADGEGRIIDFRNTLIMMTSNLDSATIEAMCAEEPWPEPDDLLSAIRPTLNQFFKPALLARMAVIPFYPISSEVMKRIVVLKLRKVAQRVDNQYGARLITEPAVLAHISERCALVEAGARNIDHILNSEILPILADAILKRLVEGTVGKRILLALGEVGFQVSFPEHTEGDA